MEGVTPGGSDSGEEDEGEDGKAEEKEKKEKKEEVKEGEEVVTPGGSDSGEEDEGEDGAAEEKEKKEKRKKDDGKPSYEELQRQVAELTKAAQVTKQRAGFRSNMPSRQWMNDPDLDLGKADKNVKL